MLTRLRARAEWQLFAILPRADRRLAVAWWAVLVLRGVLPAAFAVAMGVLIGAVQGGRALLGPLALMGVVFVLLQVLAPLHQVISANLGSRVSAWLYDRLTEACVGPPGMGHLEDPDLTSDLTVAREFDFGMTGPPMYMNVDFIAGGLVEGIGGVASAVVLAAYAWWAPLLLGGAWLATHWLLRESSVWRDRNTDDVREAQRHAEYAYKLAVDPPAAKELRLFGLAGWTIDRFITRRPAVRPAAPGHPAAGEAGHLEPPPHRRRQRDRLLVAGRRRQRRPARPRRGGGLRPGRRRHQHDRLWRPQLGHGRRRRPRGRRPAPRGGHGAQGRPRRRS